MQINGQNVDDSQPRPNIPILLSVADMEKLSIYFDNTTDRLVRRSSGEMAKIARINGHAFYRWNPDL